MAIAGSLLKQAARIVGKAIKITKKKKGQVGGKLKKQFKKEADFIDKKIVKPAKDRVSTLKKSLQSQKIKGMPLGKVKGGEKINPDLLKRFQKKVQASTLYTGTKAKASQVADAALNTQAFTKGAKAFKAGTTKAKAGLGKAQGIAGSLADDTMAAIKANPTKAMGVGAAALLTPSLLKATMKTQQMYTYEKNPDGSFDLKFKDGNVTTMKEYMYSPQQVDDIRTRLAILDSIVLSDDPYARRSEFKKEALALANRYGITAIQGKNLSLQFASDGWGNKIKG